MGTGEDWWVVCSPQASDGRLKVMTIAMNISYCLGALPMCLLCVKHFMCSAAFDLGRKPRREMLWLSLSDGEGEEAQRDWSTCSGRTASKWRSGQSDSAPCDGRVSTPWRCTFPSWWCEAAVPLAEEARWNGNCTGLLWWQRWLILESIIVMIELCWASAHSLQSTRQSTCFR